MTALIFVDTNVLLYEKDVAETTKRVAAKAWIDAITAAEVGRVSFQVLVEFQSAVAKVAPAAPVRDVRATLRGLSAWNPVVIDLHMIEGAWAIQDRYGISWWDALIVAAAEVAGCEYLLTEDLQDGQQFGTLRVVDPFVHEPGAVLG